MRHLFPFLFFLLATLWLPAQTWTLSWSDEFNGAAIDDTKWGYDIGTGAAQGLWGWGNGELQYYTDDADNASVSGAISSSLPARRISLAAITPPHGW